jgi:hypothetical protein
MRFPPALLAACLVAGLLSCVVGRARADAPADVPQADREAIAAVIGKQIDAFRHDDAPAAFGYASPMIQGMFGDPAHFLAMVQRGYPPVYRPRSVQFGALVMRDGRIVQRVDIVGPDGTGELALYTMEREPDGTWRIDGCQLTEPDSVGT